MAKRTEVTCQKCGRTKKASSFLPTYSKFFPFGTVDICTDCIEDMIDEENGSLNFISKICQWLDVPLKTEIWGPLYKNNGAVAITTYVKMVLKDYYPSVDWSSTEEYYQELLKERRLEEAVPEIQELKLEKLRENMICGGVEVVNAFCSLILDTDRNKLRNLVKKAKVEAEATTDTEAPKPNSRALFKFLKQEINRAKIEIPSELLK